MAFTLANLLDDRVRKLLEDPETPVAPAVVSDWQTPDLITWYNDFLIALRKDRADAFLDVDAATIIPIVYATAKTDPFLLDDAWIQAATHFVCWKAFLQDSGNQRNAERAEYHHGQYASEIAK